jgi:2-polyprenyl-3-methyl-5-hydroxy-6-metoxy-1,4-benzoquinol methylase
LMQCAGCSVAYLDPRPTENSIARAYKFYYTHVLRRSVSTEQLGPARKMVRAMANGYRNGKYRTTFTPSSGLGRFLIPLLPPLREALDRNIRFMPYCEPGMRLLDVGFGSGAFLDFARSAGWDVFGVDQDSVAVANAAERGLPVVAGGIGVLGDEPEKFDFITMSHVIEHMHDPVAAIEKAFSLLKPGGWLYLDTPNMQSAGYQRFGSSWLGLDPPRHLVLFPWDSLSQLLKQSGFQEQVFKPCVFNYSSIALKSRAIAAGEDPCQAKRMPLLEQALGYAQGVVTSFNPRRSECVTILARKPSKGGGL